MKIARAELSAICRAVGVLAPNDSTELHNLPLVIHVRCKKRQDTGEITQRDQGLRQEGTARAAGHAGDGQHHTALEEARLMEFVLPYPPIDQSLLAPGGAAHADQP